MCSDPLAIYLSLFISIDLRRYKSGLLFVSFIQRTLFLRFRTRVLLSKLVGKSYIYLVINFYWGLSSSFSSFLSPAFDKRDCLSLWFRLSSKVLSNSLLFLSFDFSAKRDAKVEVFFVSPNFSEKIFEVF